MSNESLNKSRSLDNLSVKSSTPVKEKDKSINIYRDNVEGSSVKDSPLANASDTDVILTQERFDNDLDPEGTNNICQTGNNVVSEDGHSSGNLIPVENTANADIDSW